MDKKEPQTKITKEVTKEVLQEVTQFFTGKTCPNCSARFPMPITNFENDHKVHCPACDNPIRK
jgi:predicted Zn-dependent protease